MVIPIGEQFGRWTVVGSTTWNGNTHFICDCACGKQGIRVIPNNLKRGISISCGCYKRDRTKQRWAEYKSPTPSCHPDKPYHSKGLCEHCYITEYTLGKRYGLTVKTRDHLLEEQNNQCPLCNRPFTNTGDTTPHVDHCHATGIVRGILCNGCNTALGKLGDTEDAILRVLDYLRRGNKCEV